jgi:hypothetical protein
LFAYISLWQKENIRNPSNLPICINGATKANPVYFLGYVLKAIIALFKEVIKALFIIRIFVVIGL